MSRKAFIRGMGGSVSWLSQYIKCSARGSEVKAQRAQSKVDLFSRRFDVIERVSLDGAIATLAIIERRRTGHLAELSQVQVLQTSPSNVA
jgi:hypothetical protein